MKGDVFIRIRKSIRRFIPVFLILSLLLSVLCSSASSITYSPPMDGMTYSADVFDSSGVAVPGYNFSRSTWYVYDGSYFQGEATCLNFSPPTFNMTYTFQCEWRLNIPILVNAGYDYSISFNTGFGRPVSFFGYPTVYEITFYGSGGEERTFIYDAYELSCKLSLDSIDSDVEKVYVSLFGCSVSVNLSDFIFPGNSFTGYKVSCCFSTPMNSNVSFSFYSQCPVVITADESISSAEKPIYPGADTSSLEDMENVEGESKEQNEEGISNANKSFSDSLSTLVQYLSGFQAFAAVFNKFSNVPFFGGLISLSVSLGLFSFLVGMLGSAISSVFRSSERDRRLSETRDFWRSENRKDRILR